MIGRLPQVPGKQCLHKSRPAESCNEAKARSIAKYASTVYLIFSFGAVIAISYFVSDGVPNHESQYIFAPILSSFHALSH